MHYAAAQFEVWATATSGGVTGALDIIRFVCSYQRNTIPTATISVPIGKEVTSWEDSNVYDLTPGSMDRIRIQVHLKGHFGGTSVTEGDGPIIPTPATGTDGVEYVIFDGWLTGISYHREREKLYANLDITHWLSDLNFGSAMSQSSCPSNPVDLSFKAEGVLPGAGVDQTTGAAAAFYATLANLGTDFWEATLKPWFAWMLSEDRMFGTQFAAGMGHNDSTTFAATAALMHMTTHNFPLAWDFSGDNLEGLITETGIIEDLVQNVADPDGEELALANVTIWEKLVGHLVPTYHFDVIPRPGDVLIRAVVPTLNATPYVTLLARDQSIVKLNAGLQRPIRAVGLFHNGFTGGLVPQVNLVDGAYPSSVVGFAESTSQPNGMVLFRQAPHFLAAPDPVGNRNYIDFVAEYADAINGPVGVLGRSQIPNGHLRYDTMNSKVRFGNRIAQIMYMEEALKERNGVVAGPLRLDICPGSLIKVEGIERPGDHFFALVQGVNYFIDADQQQAATAFQLGYMRSPGETGDATLSAPKHPLYTGASTWVGATMYTPTS